MNRQGPWIALSCGLLRHPKLRKVDPTARLLYIAGVLHCGDELTDGLIERDSLPFLWPLIGVTPREGGHLVKQLQNAALWHPAENVDGWIVNDYLDWNPDRKSWERQRELNANRQAKHRAKASDHAETAGSDGERNALRDARRYVQRREREKTTKSGWVENLSNYTGCKLVRGSHGMGHRRDVLGTDRPPADWPYPRPSRQEILTALERQERQASGLGELREALGDLAEQAGG